MNILELAVAIEIAKEGSTAKKIVKTLRERGLQKGANYQNVYRILQKLVKQNRAEFEWQEGRKIYKSSKNKLKEMLEIAGIEIE